MTQRLDLTDRQQQLLVELDRAPMLLGSRDYRASDASALFVAGLATSSATHLELTAAGRDRAAAIRARQWGRSA